MSGAFCFLSAYSGLLFVLVIVGSLLNAGAATGRALILLSAPFSYEPTLARDVDEARAGKRCVTHSAASTGFVVERHLSCFDGVRQGVRLATLVTELKAKRCMTEGMRRSWRIVRSGAVVDDVACHFLGFFLPSFLPVLFFSMSQFKEFEPGCSAIVTTGTILINIIAEKK